MARKAKEGPQEGPHPVAPREEGENRLDQERELHLSHHAPPLAQIGGDRGLLPAQDRRPLEHPMGTAYGRYPSQPPDAVRSPRS